MSNNTRHISLIRLHDFTEYPMLVLDSVSPHVDGFLFVVSDRTDPELRRIAESHPQTIEVATDNERWHNGPSLDRCFRIVDRLKPETVLYTDHDEVLPERYAECFQLWQKTKRPVAAFQYLFCWGDPQTVLARRVRCYWHAKLLRWTKGIRFVPYRGCCLPSGLRQPARLPYPLRHLPFTTLAMRKKRLACGHRRRCDRAWIKAETNPTMPYDPAMTFAKWLTAVSPPAGG